MEQAAGGGVVQRYFHWADYLVLALALALSFAIGNNLPFCHLVFHLSYRVYVQAAWCALSILYRDISSFIVFVNIVHMVVR